MTGASARRLALLVGASCAPFRDGIAAAVSTPWDIVSIPDDPSVSAELIGRADAAVTIHYSKAWPLAPNVRLLQVPGAGYDGIELAAIPAGVTLCNVFEHEPGVSEYALLAMLEWCHRLGPADREMRAGRWTRPARSVACTAVPSAGQCAAQPACGGMDDRYVASANSGDGAKSGSAGARRAVEQLRDGGMSAPSPFPGLAPRAAALNPASARSP
jgi:hypothetical protein